MPFEITVQSAHFREATLKALADATPQKTEPFYEYQSRLIDLPVVMVPIELPIYRMANFRTRVAQQSFARREQKAEDFFLAGEENEEAQKRQHEFLLKFAKEGRQGSITPIIDVLQSERQRQPILITRRGVVVNGNRRLAAMRDLYGTETNSYREFSHIKCQLLPATATEKEIIEVEVRLQMKQRTELDYDWINECIATKELRDSNRPMAELMALMNKKKAEIEDSINALTEANLYLSEWLNRPGDYDSIEDAEQLFYDIGENIKNKSGQTQEVSRRIAWMLADRRRSLKRRVYDFKPMFGKKAEEVASKLADRFALDVDQTRAQDSENTDDVEIDLGGDDDANFWPLIALIDDPARREEVATSLVDVCEGIIEIERDKRSGQMPLNLIQQANGKLSEVEMTRADASSFPAIAKQLEAIDTTVAKIRMYIERQTVTSEAAAPI